VEFAGRGGLIQYAFQLCRAFATGGAQVTLITDQQYELQELDHSFQLVKLFTLWDPKPAFDSAAPEGSLRRKLRRLVRALRYYREWMRLISYLRREKPDLVQFGDIRFPSDLVCFVLLRLCGLRLTDVCHNVYPYAVGGKAVGTFRRSNLIRAFYKLIYRQFDRVLVHYEVNRREFLGTFHLPEHRVICIPHGNEEIFEELANPAIDAPTLRRQLGFALQDRVVLFFGTFARYKGIDLLLEAFVDIHQAEPRARLVLVGFAAGFELDEHQRFARQLGIEEYVRFIPRYVEAHEVAAWMKLAAVAVFPYRAVYQSGALHLAQTFGVPVVATAVGAMTEVVRDGENGLIVPAGDHRALAGAVAKILRDVELATSLGKRGYHDSRTHYSWDRIAEQVLDEYRRLLRGSSGQDSLDLPSVPRAAS
jgi:glycosyltransferase involved in cell wall biosynthesis